MKKRSMGGHHGKHAGKEEWITPRHILQALGLFDLDPCASEGQPWPTATTQWAIKDDGLSREWFGRVYLNPPYGSKTGTWMDKLAEHGNGIALIFARVETDVWFDHIWSKASGILFLRRRLWFHHVDGTRADKNSGAPSALIAFGEDNFKSLQTSGLAGALINNHAEIRHPCHMAGERHSQLRSSVIQGGRGKVRSH